MLLYIARHAWAGERGDPRWPDDSLRPLTPEGIERYTAMIKLLAQRDFAPARIATSPFTRCRETAEILAKLVKSGPAIDELVALEPGSDLEALIEWANAQAGASVCWVGHSPDVDGLASALVGDGGSNVRFAKGAVAAIEFDGVIGEDAGELRWLVTAKVLGI
jgi:phosphohistidine phosphatase SixA